MGALSSPVFADPASIDAIPCDPMEGQAVHVHAHLSVIDHGRPTTVPEDVGRPLGAACYYWLHTHRADGIIHVEAPVERSFTLGEFLDIWGTLDPNLRDAEGPASRRIWLDGTVFSGRLRAIVLRRHTQIVIEIGEPFITPATFSEWRGL